MLVCNFYAKALEILHSILHSVISFMWKVEKTLKYVWFPIKHSSTDMISL